MAKLDVGQAEFLFHCDALSGTSLHVHRFVGEEALNQPFAFVIDLVSEDGTIDLDASIGKAATLTLIGRLPSGDRYQRYVHGVIERFVQTSAGIRQSRYEATLVPTIKSQHYTRDSRIFQQMTAPDVTKKVLKDAQIPSDAVNTLLHGSYGARDYCVQYQESNLNFVQRLWEEEGISYHFEHDKEKDVLVLGDGSHAFAALPHYAEVSHRDTPHLYEESVYELRAESSLHSGGAVLRDFKFKQPGLELEAEEQAGPFGELSSYYFPGEYVEPGLGKKLAKIRLEEQRCRKNSFLGKSNVRAMCPGFTLTLADHRRHEFNQKYLIVAVRHEGTQPQALREHAAGSEASVYENRIVCIPAKSPFRPARVTPRPLIPGVQTAIVVGPSGEEIHCDEHGRVKVQFHWDREGKKDDHSSCWIRVSQPWGGVAFGGIFIPRIGQEVLLQFLEGDPDRPVVSGRVYNGENPLPYPLPDKKTVSSLKTASSPGGGGYNELRFEDAAGSEEIFLHGQLDMNTIIERDRTQKIGRDASDTIGHDLTASVGHDRTRSVSNNESITVGNDRSASIGKNETLQVGVNQTQTIGANQTESIGANQQLSVGANRLITVGATHTELVGAAMSITVGGMLTETVGINYTEMVGGSLSLTVGGGSSETVGSGKTSTIGSALSENIGADHSEKIGGNQSINVAGGASLQAGKDIALQAGKAISGSAGKEITLNAGTKVTIVAADELTLKVGSATIVLKKSGDICVNGSKISVKASGDLVMKGSKIAQN